MKINQKVFNERMSKIFGDEYDFSKSVYINQTTDVEVFCKKHGTFFKKPKNLFRGHCCPKCGKERMALAQSIGTDKFIKQAMAVHLEENYDYSESKYLSKHKKIKIICHKLNEDGTEHGEFYQIARNHLRGQGCPICGKEKNFDNIRKSLVDFIAQANSIHNNTYDYSNSIYINTHTPTEIICHKKYPDGSEHGSFLQRPNDHLRGCGCPVCGNLLGFETKKKNGSLNTSSSEEFLAEKLNIPFISVERNYNKDPRYPFLCDFYIPERDLFVELNAHFTHNPKFGWFNPRKKSHQEEIKRIESKPDYKVYYSSLKKVWSEKDVLKRKTAKKNNLNYVVLWNEQDIEDWFALGCPDGHDGDGMYTWKE